MKNLFKLLTVTLFTAAILCSFSFATTTVTKEAKSNLIIKQSTGKYVYFRIYVRDNDTFYFSNVIWVEGGGSDFVNNLDTAKKRFKKTLKRDFDIDWTAAVQDYQDTKESISESDRERRISQCGDKWKSIEL